MNKLLLQVSLQPRKLKLWNNLDKRIFLLPTLFAWLRVLLLLQHRIEKLSGGERQRVALARALLSQPSLLLLDEPLASVDQHQRATVLPYIQRLCAAQLLPIIYVSHDLDEVAALAHDIIHLVDGKVLQQGPAPELLVSLREIYDATRTEMAILKAENQHLKARCEALEKVLAR